ncbi:MAG: hypothetical protein EXS41_02975 [Opitutaceae bacterium]|nr:hypothetical protein [Opitutaceae bacterium]
MPQAEKVKQAASNKKTDLFMCAAACLVVWVVRPSRGGRSGNYQTARLLGRRGGRGGRGRRGVGGGRGGRRVGRFATRKGEGGNEGQEVCDFHVVVCCYVFV